MYNLDNEFILKMKAITKIDDGLDFILTHIDNLLQTKYFLLVDNIFTDIIEFDVMTDPHYLAGILIATLNNKEDLYSREDFYEWVRAKLILKVGREEALDILMGLK